MQRSVFHMGLTILCQRLLYSHWITCFSPQLSIIWLNPHFFEKQCYNIKWENIDNIEISLTVPERKLQRFYLNTIRFCKNKREVQHKVRKHIWDNSLYTGLLLLTQQGMWLSQLPVLVMTRSLWSANRAPTASVTLRLNVPSFKCEAQAKNWAKNIHRFPLKSLCHFTGKGSV